MPSTATVQFNLSVQDQSTSPGVAGIRMYLTGVPIASDCSKSRVTLASASTVPLDLGDPSAYNALVIVNHSPVSAVKISNLSVTLQNNTNALVKDIVLPPGSVSTFPASSFAPNPATRQIQLTCTDATVSNPVPVDILLR